MMFGITRPETVAISAIPLGMVDQLGPTSVVAPSVVDWSLGFVPLPWDREANGFAVAVLDWWKCRVIGQENWNAAVGVRGQSGGVVGPGVRGGPNVGESDVLAQMAALGGGPVDMISALNVVKGHITLSNGIGPSLVGMVPVNPMALGDVLIALRGCGGLAIGMWITESVWNDGVPLSQWNLTAGDSVVGAEMALLLKCEGSGGKNMKVSVWGETREVSWDYWQTYAGSVVGGVWSDWTSPDGLSGSGLVGWLASAVGGP